MSRRRWRRLERRAVIGHQRDLQRAVRALGAAVSPILATDITDRTGSAVVLGLSVPGYRLSLVGAAASGLGALRRVAADSAEPLVLRDGGRYGRLWWVGISGERHSCTVVGVALGLRPDSGGSGMVEHPGPGRPELMVNALRVVA